MQSPGDREYEERVIDNGVILFSLLVTRSVVGKSKAFPKMVRKRLLERLKVLIKEYRNPKKGISYDDPDDNKSE